MSNGTPIEWCMTVRELRRELHKFDRELKAFDQNLYVMYDDYMAHETRPLQKCEFIAHTFIKNLSVIIRRYGKPHKKLSKRRLAEIRENYKGMLEAANAE